MRVMPDDENTRRTLQFFATFIRENPVEPKKLAELLLRAEGLIGTLSEELVRSSRQITRLQSERDAMLAANETLLEKCQRYSDALKKISDNIAFEPYAADYAKDAIDGKEIQF